MTSRDWRRSGVRVNKMPVGCQQLPARRSSVGCPRHTTTSLSEKSGEFPSDYQDSARASERAAEYRTSPPKHNNLLFRIFEIVLAISRRVAAGLVGKAACSNYGSRTFYHSNSACGGSCLPERSASAPYHRCSRRTCSHSHSKAPRYSACSRRHFT